MTPDDHSVSAPTEGDDAPMTFASPEEEAAFLQAVEEGIADAEAGRLIPAAAIRKWVESWGTPNELPPPECP